MASPPPSYTPAGSPPHMGHTQIPSKKRPAGAPELSSAKRRKASTMSITSATSAHPLRQTSFPPDESQGRAFSPSHRRSPSIDNMSLVSGSQVSAAPAKKKRGRKSKAERAREAEEAARGGSPSVVGGATASVVSTGSGNRKQGGGGGGDGGGGDEEGDGGRDDGGAGAFDIPENMASKAAARSKEQIKEDDRLRALLKQRMTDDQFHRYEVWHQSKITLANIRKYINSVTSQSVQPSIPQAMQVVCKLFVGDIVEEARRVQEEWIQAGEKQVDPEAPGLEEPKGELSEESKHRRQAPLRPDHMQEAYRRWKKSNGGGGSGGSLMIWNQQTRNGSERFGPRTGGRRIFR
ncbi:hypothetical protein PG999_012187 [Apiospora kogelbergensis]|uniref:TAFII28-like protein domain-containing protein n=1 Tax=Apiospora kogelbergensis TaxID=1337665 RepID=A0AAW0QKQ7_9PEZI